MRNLDLNELPSWSDWPSRLLGLEQFSQKHRTIEKIKSEYDEDKWKRCLDLYLSSENELDAVDLRFSITNEPVDKEIAAVVDERLVIIKKNQLIDMLFDLLSTSIAPYLSDSDTIIELGSAFGTNLWALSKKFPDATYLGGDYSENAVELSKHLYGESSNISVSKLDFYQETYDALEKVTEPAIIFTSQAIEQLPSVEYVIDTLGKYRDKIHTVINLEPAYDLHDDSLMGLMRRRYLEINDYNRDLISQLEKRSSDIEIMNIKKDIIGFVPFNSLTLVEWKFL
jgi:hypothetical protein